MADEQFDCLVKLKLTRREALTIANWLKLRGLVMVFEGQFSAEEVAAASLLAQKLEAQIEEQSK